MLLFLFSKHSLFSFAEGSLFFYDNLFRQRQGLCPWWCKTTRNTCQSAVAYGSASWGVPSPASFEKLDQTLTSFATVQLQKFIRICNFLVSISFITFWNVQPFRIPFSSSRNFPNYSFLLFQNISTSLFSIFTLLRKRCINRVKTGDVETWERNIQVI